MIESCRIITEEQWKEYRQLKCSDRLLRDQIEKLNKQLKDANNVIGSYADYANWNHDNKFIDYDTDLENDRLACEYLQRWSIK